MNTRSSESLPPCHWIEKSFLGPNHPIDGKPQMLLKIHDVFQESHVFLDQEVISTQHLQCPPRCTTSRISSIFVHHLYHLRGLLAGDAPICVGSDTWSLDALKVKRSCGELSKALQPITTFFPMSRTECGMVKIFKERQPAKAQSPIRVTDCGMVKVVNEVQPKSPI